MNEDKEIFLPDTTVKYGTLKRVLKEVYDLELKEMKKEDICPVGTEIQTLLFSKEKFTKKTAKSWADKYDFKYGKVDETENNFRLRQQEPSDFHKGTFRTIQIKDGLQAVIGCPKEKDGRKVRMAEGGNVEVAKTILAQLGGAGRLNAMTGAYNFIAMPNGVSFRIKNQRANYIKITLTSMDLYDLEVGRIRGDKYTVVAKREGLYNDMLKPAIEKATGMYLSLFKQGGTIDSVRKFTQEDFDKLMNSGLFSASKYMRVIVITKKDGGRFLARFNPEKNYLFINGEKDLSNPIVKWLSENSYVTKSEYRKLEDGGTIDNEMENKLWDNITSGDYYDFEKGGNMPNNWIYSIGGL